MGVGCNTPENNNTSGRNISNKIPLDQYICPECGKVPKLISFYSDNGLIQFKCKDKEHKIMKVEDYMVALNNSKFNYFNDSCSTCKKIQHKEIRNGIFSYCYDCQKKFCPTHKNKLMKENMTNIVWIAKKISVKIILIKYILTIPLKIFQKLIKIY